MSGITGQVPREKFHVSKQFGFKSKHENIRPLHWVRMRSREIVKPFSG